MNQSQMNKVMLQLLNMSVAELETNVFLKKNAPWAVHNEAEDLAAANSPVKPAFTGAEGDVNIPGTKARKGVTISNSSGTWTYDDLIYVRPLSLKGIVNTVHYCNTQPQKKKIKNGRIVSFVFSYIAGGQAAGNDRLGQL